MSQLQVKKRSKAFKVASVSANTNSFGLRGMVLVAQDGEAWEVAANYLNVKVRGDVLKAPLAVLADGRTEASFEGMGFEIPRRLPDAPPGVVKEIWSA